MSLIVNVGKVVLLEWARTFEPVLELGTLLDDLRYLSVREDSALLEVVELIGHTLKSVLDYVSHSLLRFSEWTRSN